MSEWLTTTIEAGGVDCGGCGQWRGLYGDQYIEECPNCQDDEFDIFVVDEMSETVP